MLKFHKIRMKYVEFLFSNKKQKAIVRESFPDHFQKPFKFGRYFIIFTNNVQMFETNHFQHVLIPEFVFLVFFSM